MVIALAAILVPLLVVAGVLFFVFRREGARMDAVKGRMAELDARVARASLAHATVLSSRTRGTFDDGAMAFVDLRLEVQPPGGAPYLASTEWELDISSIPLVELGKSVAVKIDSRDPKLIYPNVSWAKLSRAFIARGVMGNSKQ